MPQLADTIDGLFSVHSKSETRTHSITYSLAHTTTHYLFAGGPALPRRPLALVVFPAPTILPYKPSSPTSLLFIQTGGDWGQSWVITWQRSRDDETAHISAEARRRQQADKMRYTSVHWSDYSRTIKWISTLKVRWHWKPKECLRFASVAEWRNGIEKWK